jgi:hypothetical protein
LASFTTYEKTIVNRMAEVDLISAVSILLSTRGDEGLDIWYQGRYWNTFLSDRPEEKGVIRGITPPTEG